MWNSYLFRYSCKDTQNLFSAPEVIEGSPYGKAIDYWSLGVVLYQFMVGKPPFEFDGDFAKLLRSIYSVKIKFPRQFMSVNASSFLDGVCYF